MGRVGLGGKNQGFVNLVARIIGLNLVFELLEALKPKP